VKVLSTITETFLALSTSSIASIRDAVTEASLSFGKILLQVTLDLRVKAEESSRQLSATSRGAGSAKQKAIISMSKETKKVCQTKQRRIVLIFLSIFLSLSLCL
jgi:hypothetical protein